jgi:hypothetical protein
MDLHDPLDQLPVGNPALDPARLRPDPGMVVAVIGDQYPAQPPNTEPGATGMDEREPIPRGRVVDQWFRGLAQNLIPTAQVPYLALVPAQFGTQLLDSGCKVAIAAAADRHEHELRRNASGRPRRVSESWPKPSAVPRSRDRATPVSTGADAKVVSKTVRTPRHYRTRLAPIA